MGQNGRVNSHPLALSLRALTHRLLHVLLHEEGLGKYGVGHIQHLFLLWLSNHAMAIQEVEVTDHLTGGFRNWQAVPLQGSTKWDGWRDKQGDDISSFQFGQHSP
jgi:hypothetical protein